MIKEFCDVCDNQVHVAIFKGTGICSEKCRKIRSGELPPYPVAKVIYEPDEPNPKVGSPEWAERESWSEEPVVAKVKKSKKQKKVDLNNQLNICKETHDEEATDGEELYGFGHGHDINRVCIRLFNSHTWVYDPNWENHITKTEAEVHDHKH